MNIKEITLATAILGVAIAICGIEQAQAADLHGGMKDGPVVNTDCNCSETINWTGLSIGIQGGVTAGNHDVKVSAPGEESGSAELDGLGAFGLSGRIFGQGDYQIGDLVIGARVWYGLTNAETKATISNGIESESASLEEQDNFGGVVRLGRLFGGEKRTLIYGVGGWERVSYDITNSAGLDLTDAIDTHPKFSGPVAGLGIEYALSQVAFFSLEYQHAFFGTEDVSKIPSFKIEDSLDTDTIHAGLRLKF